MTAPADVVEVPDDVVESPAVALYRSGLSLRQVAARLGVSHSKVQLDVLRAGVPMRPAVRHLTVVRDRPARARPAPRTMAPPDRVSLAYTADRGWHLVEAPPGWFLEMMADID